MELMLMYGVNVQMYRMYCSIL